MIKAKDEIGLEARAEKIGAEKEALRIAINLLDVLDIKTISLATGIVVEEIEKLIKLT